MSEHFKSEEFWCKCNEPDCSGRHDPHPALVLELEIMRSILGKPITITSGIRCPKQNALAGGVSDSEHLTGEGADLACPSSGDRYAMVNAALKSGFRRLGIGKTFLHVGMSRKLQRDVCWTYYPKGEGNG